MFDAEGWYAHRQICHRAFYLSRFRWINGLIYAGAQKNIGPAGLTLVIIRKDLLEQASEYRPMVMNYKNQHTIDSMLNTPSTYAWYLSGLVFEWLLEQGGVEAIAKVNHAKAKRCMPPLTVVIFIIIQSIQTIVQSWMSRFIWQMTVWISDFWKNPKSRFAKLKRSSCGRWYGVPAFIMPSHLSKFRHRRHLWRNLNADTATYPNFMVICY